MITIKTIREIPAEQFVCDISEYEVPELFELYKMFGYETVFDSIDDALSYDEFEEDDDSSDAIRDNWFHIVKECCIKTGRKIPISKMDALNLDEDDCKEHKIPYVQDMDEEGNEVFFVDEQKEQMKLFPELEEGLPPYRLKIVKKKVA